MVVVVLLLLVEDLQLQEELLLVEELRVGRVHLGGTLFVRLLVWRDVLVVLQLLDLDTVSIIITLCFLFILPYYHMAWYNAC